MKEKEETAKIYEIELTGYDFINSGYLLIYKNRGEAILTYDYLLIPNLKLEEDESIQFLYVDFSKNEEKLFRSDCNELYIPEEYQLTNVNDSSEICYLEIRLSSISKEQCSKVLEALEIARKKFNSFIENGAT